MSYISDQNTVIKLCKKFGIKELRGGGHVLLEFREDDECGYLSPEETQKVHERGFTAYDWITSRINENTVDDYMSIVEYSRGHPYNGVYSAWVDDKLTLKYLCLGTETSQYMPDYYFQINDNSEILYLCDCPNYLYHKGYDGIIELLHNKKYLAIKAAKGARGEGFYKAKIENNKYYLNDKAYDRLLFCDELKHLKNYIITEYLISHPDFLKFNSATTNSIRYQAARIDGKFQFLFGFVRFGTKKSNFVDNFHAGACLAYLDNKGHYKDGYIINLPQWTTTKYTHHPDTGELLDGYVPLWNEIEKAVKAFEKTFPQLEYLGFDFVITSDNKVKILEINSLSGLDGMQMNGGVKKKPWFKYFENKIKFYHHE